MKKYLFVLVVSLLLTGQTSFISAADTSAGSGRISIVTTIFPEYDWVMKVLDKEAGHADVKMLLDRGADLHNFQPSVKDIAAVSSCDLFIYVGGESDEWVEDILNGTANRNIHVINLLEVLGSGAREEELVEGMEKEDHEHEEEGVEYDEHVWLSLRNAALFVDAIASELGAVDPSNATAYKSNAEAYKKKLSALDSRYKAELENTSKKTILLGDRFPFRYLADDYGLSYYAAFAGCSAETEASFKTIVFLAGKADELSLHTILQIDSSDGRIAKAVRQNTKDKKQKILTLDSLQSSTLKDYKKGKTYLSVMEENLEVLKKALR